MAVRITRSNGATEKSGRYIRNSIHQLVESQKVFFNKNLLYFHSVALLLRVSKAFCRFNLNDLIFSVPRCLCGVMLFLTVATAVTAAGIPLGDELLAPAAPRPAPRSRPEIAPQPMVYTARSVLYAARSADGRQIVTVEKGDSEEELWLYPQTATLGAPRQLLTGPVRLAAPALNRDGSLLAYVDARNDVKGDIWLLDLVHPAAEPRRLTGQEGAEDAPVFTPDGTALVFQRQLADSEQRGLMRLQLASGQSEPLPISMDAAFPAPAPDGQRWVFVSRQNDPGGDLWLWDARDQSQRQLTGGAVRDLYPSWEGADTLLFTRFPQTGAPPVATADSPQLFRLHLDQPGSDGLPAAFPLTSTALAAVAPISAGERLLFLAGQGSGGQVMALPNSGEIPERPTVAAQWELAQLLLQRQPPDPARARLAAARVLARETEPTREGAKAVLALAGLQEKAGESGTAQANYAAAAARYRQFMPEAAQAEIARLRLQTAAGCRGATADRCPETMAAAGAAMLQAANGNGAQASARALIDHARLLTEQGGRAADQLAAIVLCDQALALQDLSRPLQAEAALRRALLLARLEKGEGALAALVEVAKSYNDQEEWAESAITAILDQVAPRESDDRLGLAALAERYRTTLPRLAMGAWNRIGDLGYRANEWAKAKDAYRTVLEQFAPLPTPTAAARFARAEILYREERYAEAKELYEKEMADNPEDAPLYQLARAAYIRKTLAGGENLYRSGEVAAARTVFLDLIRYDGRSIEAHRGYIKSVAAMGQTAELLTLYRRMLASYPDDPILLYATGLCLTYLPGRGPLTEADQLLSRAEERLPGAEYPPQTRGYLAEVLETVHGERGGLERALALYRRAWLLNRPQENPENRANLDLNIGNMAFLLGNQATALKHYRQRRESGIPFDQPDTELIFQQRYAVAAFQMREKQAPIDGYLRALQLTEGRLDPARPLELFGKLTRRTVERLFTDNPRSSAALQALTEQQEINALLEKLGGLVPEPPPAVSYERYAATLRQLLARQQTLINAAESWNQAGLSKSGAELPSMLAGVTKALEATPRLVAASAEIHDRLGLAYLEAEQFGPAREHFAAAYRLNEGLGNTGNLVANRRSASIAAYREAEIAAGAARLSLLRTARDGFRAELALIKRYPPQTKAAAERSGGLVSINKEVALDRAGATQAAFGFSSVQEQRLAETFLARILAELGEPAAAEELLRVQLARYPLDNTRLAVGDLYGVGLLSHRTAQTAHALGNSTDAAAGFKRATELALTSGNPVSAMINLVNWGELLPTGQTADVANFLPLAAKVSRLAAGYRDTLPPLALGRYHNDTGVILTRLAGGLQADGSRDALLFAAISHWDQSRYAEGNSRALTPAEQLQHGVAQLNRGAVLAALGLEPAATEARTAALAIAKAGGGSGIEWRALAALGRYTDALALLERLPFTAFDLQLGELRQRFAPQLATLAAKDGEQALALLEQLSEIERVQLLSRGLLDLDNPATLALLQGAAPHLAEMERLREQLQVVPAAEQEYLQLRLRQEQAVLDGLLGKQLDKLPGIYGQGGAEILALAAASVALDEERAIPATNEQKGAPGPAAQRFQELRARVAKACTAGKGGKLCQLIVPQPVEAIDLLERLPGRTILRFTPLADSRWLLFTIGGKAGVIAEAIDRPTLEARLNITPQPLAAYEEPWQFATAPVLSWGLSGSQLLRAAQARKPFRRQVLDPAGWWPVAEPFTRLAANNLESALAEAQLLVLPGRAGLLAEVPTVPGSAANRLPLWEDQGGVRRTLGELAGAAGLALVVAPRAGIDQAYALGQLLALQGVPSLLVGENTTTVAAQPFVAAYATKSLATASELLPGRWLLVGDWGPDAAEAAALGKRRFTDYGKQGVTAHNAGRYPAALALFENALAIAKENPDLAKHRTMLHRYARESAFAAGLTERAISHAEALLTGIAKEKPFSADHADALLRLGLLQGRAERFTAAAVSLKEGVAIFNELGLAKEQAAAMADFGVVMENAVDYPAARSLFEEAATLRRTLKDDLSVAEQYRNLGRLHDLRLNQYALAERYYAQAGAIYAKAGNGALEAETLLERGRCQRLLGNFPAAERLYQEALAKAGNQELRTRMRIVLEQANNAWFQGRYQDAFDQREQVEKSAIKEQWPLEQVMAKNTGGLIWWTLGDTKRALLELREALARAEQLEVRRDEVATSLNNIGLVQREAGDYPAALATLDKALAIDRKLGSRWAIAYDLRNLGQTRLKMGDPTTARTLLQEAAVMAGAIGDKVNQAKILLAMGDTESKLQQPAAAETSYRQALELADAMLLREVRWRALYGLARLQQAAGAYEIAIASYQQALETVEGLRAEIRLDQLKDGFLADKMDLYAGMVGLLVDLKRSDEAFAVAERSRSRNLIDILGRQRLSLAGAGSQELYDRQTMLREQILEQETLAVQASKPQERAMYNAALDKLRAGYQDLLLDIERQKPELLALVKVSPISLAEIRQQLEPEVVLLSYYQLADRLLCWRITRDEARLFEQQVSAADLGARITSYRRMLQNLEPLEKLSKELYDTLLAEPLAGIGTTKAIGIIPHGSLHYLAFATLQDGHDYLIDRQRLFHLPAASVLRYTVSRRQAVKNLHILAIGNPDLGNTALDLPFAEREVGTLRWNYPDLTILTRERATESWVREHISEFGIIHLASHGEFDPINPLFSAIRLAKDSKADGKLQAEEVFGLNIKADLVVLSACETGLGDIRRGDDVVGMNRAFLFAGTHALMSSLWRVSDVATAILMKQFYREYMQTGKAEGLQRAMLHVKSRYPHPGYWGAFLLTGDYQ